MIAPQIEIALQPNVKSINSLKLLTADEAIERVFEGIQSENLKKELRKWYLFGLSKEGRDLIKLSPEELGSFMDKLPDIALVLYNLHQNSENDNI